MSIVILSIVPMSTACDFVLQRKITRRITVLDENY
jgi:hypothetical protein